MSKITEVTRRAIFDYLRVEGVCWHGRLAEVDFLNRLFDLRRLPSSDYRYSTALADFQQHRVFNYDWPDDWVFEDPRFELIDGDDEVFLRFLCETIHPVVRVDLEDAERLRKIYNECLEQDGFAIEEKTQISGRPVFVGRYVGLTIPSVPAAKEVLCGTDPSYVAQQITRMEAAIPDDPGLAIGTAKELVETCCRTILSERGREPQGHVDLPKLVKLTSKELELTPGDIPSQARAAETIKRLLSNLATVTQGIAELRNLYGTGHGKDASSKGLGPRHAKLVVGAASTLVVFFTETHRQRQTRSQDNTVSDQGDPISR